MMKFAAGVVIGSLLGILAAATFFRLSSSPPNPHSHETTSKSRVSAATAQPPAKASSSVTKQLAPLSTNSDAQRERAAGRYVLDSEIPWLRDRLAKNDEAALAAMMQVAGPEYQRLFAQLGLSEGTQAQLLHHLALIYREKRDVKLRQTSLANAQSAFDSQLKALLSPEKYADYRAYEAFDRARRESAQLADFAGASNQPQLPPERLADLQELVDATGAYSARTLNQWGGAFHVAAAPTPSALTESAMIEAASDLRAKSTALIEEARRRGFTNAELEVLRRYYGKEIDVYEQQITDARDPKGAQARWLERRIMIMSADPRANPEQLQRLKDSLALLRASQPGKN
jgi:hypothetical protein